MVVPCIVNSRLNVNGETKCVVRDRQLNPNQHRFNAAHKQKNQRVADVENAEPLVIDRDNPAMHQLKVCARPASATGVRSSPRFDSPALGMLSVLIRFSASLLSM